MPPLLTSKKVIKTAFKDTSQAFKDFKYKQQKHLKKSFLICKSMYILKAYSIRYTLR